jgi:hypothetical protein
VRVDDGYNLRAEYEKRIKNRITVTINRVAKKGQRPSWMPEVHFTRLMKRPEDPTWSAKAGTAKANRLKGGQDGKGPATLALGQQSAARAFNNLVSTISTLIIAFVKFRFGFLLLLMVVYFPELLVIVCQVSRRFG